MALNKGLQEVVSEISVLNVTQEKTQNVAQGKAQNIPGSKYEEII